MTPEEKKEYKNLLKKEGRWKDLLLFRAQCAELDSQKIVHAAQLGDTISLEIYPGIHRSKIYDILRNYDYDFCVNAALHVCKLMVPYYHKFYNYDGKVEKYLETIKAYWDLSIPPAELSKLRVEISKFIWEIAQEDKECDTIGNWLFNTNKEKKDNLEKTCQIIHAFLSAVQILQANIRDHYVRLTVDIYHSFDYIAGDGDKKLANEIFVDFLLSEAGDLNE